MGKQQKPFKPGRGYTKKDWEAVQSPELTAEQMAKAKPFAEVFPNLAASSREVNDNPGMDQKRFRQGEAVRGDIPGTCRLNPRERSKRTKKL
jgi:hypothetical protein